MDYLNSDFREGVYRQIYNAALAVARNQQPDVAAYAEDIAQGVVLKFARRQVTRRIENPAAWAAVQARYACMNFANRQLPRARGENVWDKDFWAESVDVNPAIYPYKMVSGADAIEFALSCLSEREREMVHLIEAGYSHAEVAEMLGYAGARSVTTTMSRVRAKIIEHVGGMAEVIDLLTPDVHALRSTMLEAPPARRDDLAYAASGLSHEPKEAV